VDSDCSVFPDRPFCDGFRCSGAQAVVTCTANGPDLAGLRSPEVAHTYDAGNGTFTDHCDANGNLIGYECETKLPSCSPGQNGCDGPLVFTGQVVPLPNVVDCGGTCLDGRCDGRCAQQGDQVTLMGEDTAGDVLLHNDSDGRMYACMPDPQDEHGANFDCAHVPQAQKGFVMGRSVADQHCTGAAFGNISVVLDNVPTPSGLDTCGYLNCGIRPTPACNFH
jgi:hypothetical protein